MTQARHTPEQIKVVVELAAKLKHFADSQEPDSQNLHSALQLHLDQLVLDLAIPATILLETSPSRPENEEIWSPFQVMIAGQKCRLPLPITLPPDVTAQELARSVAHAIHQNRELLVTAPLSKKVWEKWSSNGQASVPDASEPMLRKFLQALAPPLFKQREARPCAQIFHELLASLIRRNFKINRGERIAQAIKEQAAEEPSAATCFEAAVSTLDAIAIKIFLNDAEAGIRGKADDQPLEEILALMQEGLFYELGLVLPPVSLETDKNLAEHEFRFQLNDLRFPPLQGLEADQFLVNDTAERLRLLNITTAEPALNPANGNEAAIVKDADEALAVCRRAGLSIWGPAGFMVLQLSAEIRKNAGSFLNTEVVKSGLNLLGAAFPDLVEVALRRFEVATLTQILRDLLDEELSIRDLPGILESLLAINGTTDVDQSKYIIFLPNTENICPVANKKTVEALDIVDYSNCVRMHFKQYISHKYTRGTHSLIVYLLDPALEARLRNIPQQLLTGAEQRRLQEAIYDEVGYPTSQHPVILTTLDIRKRLKSLINREFPQLAVLSYQELSPDLNIQPLARISWDESR